ncbi:MAG: sigma-70 family RNA polymerase sigma factor [Candidatus Omnitrophota bacterium]
MEHLRDEEVMLCCQRGEAGAMEELLKRYKRAIYHFAFRLTADAEEAQDIAQEVFVRLHQFRERYRTTGKFSTWLFAIAHHLSISRLRKKKWTVLWPRKEQEPEAYVEFQSPDPSPDQIASQNELSDFLKQSIQSLPFLQREALILREYQNLDYDQISKILNKSLGTVKTLIHRARMNLKTKLLPYVEESGGGSHV